MNMEPSASEGREIELKLRLLSQSGDHRIMEHPLVKEFMLEAPDTSKLTSIYYDTLDHRLLAQGLIYRVRRKNSGWEATVKRMGSSSGGLHQREEWNMTSPDAHPRPERVEPESVRQEIMGIIDDQPLFPMLETSFHRTRIDWKDRAGNLVELSLDIGEILAGSLRQSIHEVEIELKEGNASALLTLGEALAAELPMIPEESSKFSRGLQMLGIKQSDPATNGDEGEEGPFPSQTGKLKEAVPLIFEAGFHQIISQFHALHQNPDHPDHTHQFRVKIRQLRSLLSFFKPLIPKEKYENLRNDLRNWAIELREVREMDVMADHFSQYTSEFGENRLGALIEQERKKVRDSLNHITEQGSMTPTLLKIWRETRELVPEEGADEMLLKPYVEKRMSRWIMKFQEYGRNTKVTDIPKLHELRIQGKKIRYVSEQMQGIVPEISGKNIKVMKKLQDVLGEINDIHCETLRMKSLVIKQPSSPELMHERGRYEGWQQKRLAVVNRELKEFWEKAVKRL